MGEPQKHYAKWDKTDKKKKDKCCMIPLTWTVKSIETESRTEVSKGWGEELTVGVIA